MQVTQNYKTITIAVESYTDIEAVMSREVRRVRRRMCDLEGAGNSTESAWEALHLSELERALKDFSK